jgi:transposase
VSTTSIVPYLASRRVRCTAQKFGANQTSILELVPKAHLRPICSGCNRRATQVHSSYSRSIRDLDLGEHRVTLRLQQRRVRCEGCNAVRAEAHDFVGPSARITQRLARYIAMLCEKLPLSDVARHFGLDWKLVKRCDKAVLEREFSATDNAGLRLLAVDEISLKKGHHRYMTVVLDYDSGRIVWMGAGHGFDTLSAFFEQMTPRERAGIEAVAMDMWDPYVKAVRHHLPRARIVYDLFHVVAAYHREVLDEVRKAAYRKSRDQQERRFIKGSRFLLFKKLDAVSQTQRPQLSELLRVNEEIATAYVLRDSLKSIWSTRTPWEARRSLRTWCRLATESGIPALLKFARMLRRRERGIVTHARYPINTSRLEGVNHKIKQIKRRSYGFQDPEYFTLKVKQAFPGSACT